MRSTISLGPLLDVIHDFVPLRVRSPGPDLTLAWLPPARRQARLSAEFSQLLSPDGLSKSIDRETTNVFRTRLLDFLARVRGFLMVK